jgi:uncharacterized RDD family membrane protein YckC
VSSQELEYAGFWSRTGAAIIDTLLIMAITLPLLASIYGWDQIVSPDSDFILGPAHFLINYVAPAIASILFWSYKQATPGKMVISAKILDAETGKPASTGQLIGRYFAYFISIIPLMLGIIWVAFDKRKQGWHDKLSGTVVVKHKNSGPDPVKFTAA